MAAQNRRGQCSLEVALVTTALTLFTFWLVDFARIELRNFARVQLSGGRR